MQVLNNAHHTGLYYIPVPNAFSMEGLTLINGINSIFCNLCDSNQIEVLFEIISLASILLA